MFGPEVVPLKYGVLYWGVLFPSTWFDWIAYLHFVQSWKWETKLDMSDCMEGSFFHWPVNMLKVQAPHIQTNLM